MNKIFENIKVQPNAVVPQHFEMQIAELLGAKIEVEYTHYDDSDEPYDKWVEKDVRATWVDKMNYRIAVTKHSIDWSHVSSKYNFIRCTYGVPYLVDAFNNSDKIRADVYASFVLGNVDDVVARPIE